MTTAAAANSGPGRAGLLGGRGRSETGSLLQAAIMDRMTSDDRCLRLAGHGDTRLRGPAGGRRRGRGRSLLSLA